MVVLQGHLHRGDAPAQAGDAAAGDEALAGAGAQVIDPQVDGAHPPQAVAELLGGFVAVFFGDGGGDGQGAHGIQGGGDHAAVEAADEGVAHQFGPHGEAHPGVRRVEGVDLEAQELVEVDAGFEDFPQHRFQALLFGGGAAGGRAGGGHDPWIMRGGAAQGQWRGGGALG